MRRLISYIPVTCNVFQMKKIIAVTVISSVFACTPYQKLIIAPAHRNTILMDSCDLSVIIQLRQSFDTINYNKTDDLTRNLEEIIGKWECDHYAYKFYPPREDSTLWLLMIRPATLNKDEIILGNLYTFHPNQGATFTFHRRIKKYSQKNSFESGKYLVFTYFIEDDTTTIVKKGKKELHKGM